MSLRALGTAALSALKEAAPRAARGTPTPPAPHQGPRHSRPVPAAARETAEAYLRDHVFLVYSAALAGATALSIRALLRSAAAGEDTWSRRKRGAPGGCDDSGTYDAVLVMPE